MVKKEKDCAYCTKEIIGLGFCSNPNATVTFGTTNWCESKCYYAFFKSKSAQDRYYSEYERRLRSEKDLPDVTLFLIPIIVISIMLYFFLKTLGVI